MKWLGFWLHKTRSSIMVGTLAILDLVILVISKQNIGVTLTVGELKQRQFIHWLINTKWEKNTRFYWSIYNKRLLVQSDMFWREVFVEDNKTLLSVLEVIKESEVMPLNFKGEKCGASLSLLE